MLSIRLFRTGKKNQPFFKIVVTDKRNPPKGGRFVEKLGFWNPLSKEKEINSERVKYWISQGAQPSDTMHNFLIDQKIIEGKKIAKHSKAKKKKEGEETEVKVESESTSQPEEKPAEAPVEEVKEEVKEENTQEKPEEDKVKKKKK